MQRRNIFDPFIYSFPVQLLILHLRKNQLLLLCWVFLFSVVIEDFGKVLGIPYLFLDPEYLGHIGFTSFFIMGIAIGGFTMAYHMTCYILDGAEFSFLGVMRRPFSKFALNNSFIPIIFVVVYIIKIIQFQAESEYGSTLSIIIKITGFLTGFFLMLSLLFGYFWFTNKDIFKIVASTFDKRLKQVKITRAKALSKLKDAKSKRPRVDNYCDYSLKWKSLPATTPQYEKADVLKVFDQNHLNSVIIELTIFVVILFLGAFRDFAVFQIPAAASVVLFLTIIIMITGAFFFWLRGWATSVIIIIFFIFNFLAGKPILPNNFYKAYGLDYKSQPSDYSISSLDSLNNAAFYQEDKTRTLEILENWQTKINQQQAGLLGSPKEKPKMVFICTSGGGLRSALWTTTVLQTADSATNGKLMNNAQLIAGASGGLIGAAYFRELKLQQQLQQKEKSVPPTLLAAWEGNNSGTINPYDHKHLENIAKDNLNSVIFTLLVNDMFVKHQRFLYEGNIYTKDRGYAFEEQLNSNTEGILDKKLGDYFLPEKESLIPMLLVAPVIVNDGRKLFISPQNMSYLNTNPQDSIFFSRSKIKGVDFKRFFKDHEADNLRFLSALRMNATFPYVTPNVSLPTVPEMQIMDAGISDNFGISDAIRFLFVFKTWIEENTSGVILVCIRDSQKMETIERKPGTSILQRFVGPFQFLYDNIFNTQDINHDDRVEYAKAWFKKDIYRIDFEYVYEPPKKMNESVTSKNTKETMTEWAEKPSLSWRLTTREKESIIHNIRHPKNQQALQTLQNLLE